MSLDFGAAQQKLIEAGVPFPDFIIPQPARDELERQHTEATRQAVAQYREALEKWNDLYPDLAQLLNGWTQDGSWSEWDNEVKLRVIATAADSRAALGGEA